MINILDLNDYDKYTDEEMQVFADVINAFLYAEKLKKEGALSGGPIINKKAFAQILKYCDDRNIKPAKEEEKLIEYLGIINEFYSHI